MITEGRELLWYKDSFVEALHESLVDVAREGEKWDRRLAWEQNRQMAATQRAQDI